MVKDLFDDKEKVEQIRKKVMDMIAVAEGKDIYKDVHKQIRENFKTEDEKMVASVILGYSMGKKAQAEKTSKMAEGLFSGGNLKETINNILGHNEN